jgi:hypothetical protein
VAHAPEVRVAVAALVVRVAERVVVVAVHHLHQRVVVDRRDDAVGVHTHAERLCGRRFGRRFARCGGRRRGRFGRRVSRDGQGGFRCGVRRRHVRRGRHAFQGRGRSLRLGRRRRGRRRGRRGRAAPGMVRAVQRVGGAELGLRQRHQAGLADHRRVGAAVPSAQVAGRRRSRDGLRRGGGALRCAAGGEGVERAEIGDSLVEVTGETLRGALQAAAGLGHTGGRSRRRRLGWGRRGGQGRRGGRRGRRGQGRERRRSRRGRGGGRRRVRCRRPRWNRHALRRPLVELGPLPSRALGAHVVSRVRLELARRAVEAVGRPCGVGDLAGGARQAAAACGGPGEMAGMKFAPRAAGAVVGLAARVLAGLACPAVLHVGLVREPAWRAADTHGAIEGRGLIVSVQMRVCSLLLKESGQALQLDYWPQRGAPVHRRVGELHAEVRRSHVEVAGEALGGEADAARGRRSGGVLHRSRRRRRHRRRGRSFTAVENGVHHAERRHVHAHVARKARGRLVEAAPVHHGRGGRAHQQCPRFHLGAADVSGPHEHRGAGSLSERPGCQGGHVPLR